MPVATSPWGGASCSGAGVTVGVPEGEGPVAVSGVVDAPPIAAAIAAATATTPAVTLSTHTLRRRTGVILP
ncbi:hypothetical protein Microterr_17020 [Microbacterium terricola]|uniref:Uncharacterized protein n=1 Tax=Microbacterium terricola TaxID=344163 RepID=A0ABM8DZR0_9MICO|nr:hypothetical protein Microterr_17020 [Microbacterium terricola]